MYFRSYREYLRHPVFRIVRQIAMEAAGYRCQRCRRACATEVHHHDGYPPWGTFDVPSKLMPVCHQCHCVLEGKPS